MKKFIKKLKEHLQYYFANWHQTRGCDTCEYGGTGHYDLDAYKFIVELDKFSEKDKEQ